MDFSNAPELLMLVPLVVGLVEVLKSIGTPDRFAPLASLVMGIALAFLVMPTLTAVIIGGIMVGLSASGLYSGVRTMTAR